MTDKQIFEQNGFTKDNDGVSLSKTYIDSGLIVSVALEWNFIRITYKASIKHKGAVFQGFLSSAAQNAVDAIEKIETFAERMKYD